MICQKSKPKCPSQLGRRRTPAPASLLDKLDSYHRNVEQNIFDMAGADSYNSKSLGISLAVGRLTLDTPYRNGLLSKFLKSRRQGLSHRTLQFYERMLTLASSVIGLDVKHQDVQRFLDSLNCSNGGKHGYYRCLRCFYRWLYSPKSGYDLSLQDNPPCYW